MCHPFGNYVVQRLFECSDKNTRRKIYDGVMKEENLEEIKKTNYGKIFFLTNKVNFCKANM